jgi:hypothetical protein
MGTNHRVEELEKTFISQKLDENNHYSNIFNNMRYRGWYKFFIENDFFEDTICLFRIPPAIPLYDNVLRNFPEEERMAGIHRMLIGKELREEVSNLMALFDNDASKAVANLSDEEVKSLLDKVENMITFDCNKIPYLHIRIDKNKNSGIDIKNEVKKFIESQPKYLDIFYKVLNEEISINEAEKLSSKVIYNEFIDTFKRGIKNHEGN